MSAETAFERAPVADASDPFALGRAYKHLRVADVSDALDALGRANVGLVDPAVRPLWEGLRFWGPALTMRMLPANQNTPPVPSEELPGASVQSIWFGTMALYGRQKARDLVRPGHVIVTSCGHTPEAGIWGSENTMERIVRGAVGIVTDGYCRDTDEVILQRTPVCARGRGRTITPGRVEFLEVQVPVDLGGVLVRPGDIVGADGDGVIVVPIEVAAAVLPIAATILIKDMRTRRRHYEALGMPPDRTVAVAEVQAFYAPYVSL
jgi:4-hydroxy-4-methyl-2-oxoglutarate aldolase